MEQKYTVELRLDQWDLVLLSLDHVRLMTDNAISNHAVDTLCRKFTRRRVNEIVTEITANVPETK